MTRTMLSKKITGPSTDFLKWAGRLMGLNTDIYSLVSCPAVPFGTRYLFIAIDEKGRRPIGVGKARSETPSLNLASIRLNGSRLGASEVHIYRDAQSRS